MSITKKDFEEIAECLKTEIEYCKRDEMAFDTCITLAYSLCTVFARMNPRFNQDKFLIAAGVKKE